MNTTFSLMRTDRTKKMEKNRRQPASRTAKKPKKNQQKNISKKKNVSVWCKRWMNKIERISNKFLVILQVSVEFPAAPFAIQQESYFKLDFKRNQMKEAKKNYWKMEDIPIPCDWLKHNDFRTVYLTVEHEFAKGEACWRRNAVAARTIRRANVCKLVSRCSHAVLKQLTLDFPFFA